MVHLAVADRMHLDVAINRCVRLSHFNPTVIIASVWRDVHIRHPERDLKAQKMLYSPYLTSPCHPALHSTCASSYRVSVCRMHGQASDWQRAQCFKMQFVAVFRRNRKIQLMHSQRLCAVVVPQHDQGY